MRTSAAAWCFALMGDSGSGDQPQQAVAQAMLTYFNTARRFPFVLMLGDNLYDDDYTGEFLTPYKPLLDRDVSFYATLGNHDRDLESTSSRSTWETRIGTRSIRATRASPR